ncbi:MAG: transposase [Chloroflexota bacterium]
MTSDYSNPFPSMPRETAQAANAIFGRNNFYIVIGEHIDTLLNDIQLQGLSEEECTARREGASWALITFFQFIEGLTDIQAVDAARTRLDWKFALHLSMFPARFHEYVFCEFRRKVLTETTSQHEFQRLVDRLNALVPSSNHDPQNVEGSGIATFVCTINRLNHAQQAMSQVLEVLAARFPDWLRKIALPRWYGRYNRVIPRLEVAILLGQQRFLMEEIGTDIQHLLKKIHQSGLSEMAELHEVERLDQLWTQQFKVLDPASNSYSENLNLIDCSICAYGGGRKQ